jgi:hypothetical protein
MFCKYNKTFKIIILNLINVNNIFLKFFNEKYINIIYNKNFENFENF